MAFVLTPQLPIEDWLADLDASVERSKGFFARHPVALDLSAANLDTDAIASLTGKLSERDIRVLGIEGMIPSGVGTTLPPVLRGGRDGQTLQLSEDDNVSALKRQRTASLLVTEPVRSGQSVAFTEGDVTVLGSVASGGEVIAGGSIHVYGTLRGRAMAGVTGDTHARIFCSRAEPELLAINSHYKIADDIAEDFRSQRVQAWLEGKTLRLSSMN